MNSKAVLALAVAGAVCGPAWGQDYGGNPYAPKSSTDARGNAANVRNPYEFIDPYNPYASKSSTNAYGNPSSVDRSTSPYDAVDPYNPYASKSSTDAYGNPSSMSASTHPYGAGDPYKPFTTSAPSGYRYDANGAGASTNTPADGSGTGHGRNPSDSFLPQIPNTPTSNPYSPSPRSYANHSAGGLYGEDPTGRGPRNGGLSKENLYDPLSDESLYDPLTAKRSGLSSGGGSAADPYGLSPYPAAKPKDRQLDEVSSGILGFDPFDAKTVLAPAPDTSLLPATASGGGARGIHSRFLTPPSPAKLIHPFHQWFPAEPLNSIRFCR